MQTFPLQLSQEYLGKMFKKETLDWLVRFSWSLGALQLDDTH
jgi:hypothetical protein